MHRISDIHGLYHLDLAHSALGFAVRHAGLSKVRGTFDQFQGYALIDCAHVENSALMVSISTSSINTFSAERDYHLRNNDFFDVARYPAITYVATEFAIVDDSHVQITGDLTIKDVTKQLTLVFEWTGSSTDPFGNERIGFEAHARIKRSDYGLTYNAALETGGWLIGDDIDLEIEASAVRQGGTTARRGVANYQDLPDHAADEGTELVVVASSQGMRRAIVDDEDLSPAPSVPGGHALTADEQRSEPPARGCEPVIAAARPASKRHASSSDRPTQFETPDQPDQCAHPESSAQPETSAQPGKEARSGLGTLLRRLTQRD
ncbi:YceI family protein [Luteococcus sp. OSA5]|uniref:YceI family protein n=1 Tax=Luteococcus sp. OSA5 TaxID=3401630 RepID=UPI003B432CE4